MTNASGSSPKESQLFSGPIRLPLSTALRAQLKLYRYPLCTGWVSRLPNPRPGSLPLSLSPSYTRKPHDRAISYWSHMPMSQRLPDGYRHGLTIRPFLPKSFSFRQQEAVGCRGMRERWFLSQTPPHSLKCPPAPFNLLT